MKRLWGESELEGSGVVWSMNRALRARGAALRGPAGPVGPLGLEGSSSPSKRGELGAMESDLGRGDSRGLERSERSLE